ncbi:hypothetical protein ACFL1O_00725, partial [Patescibacteria group bacterium]
FLFLVFFLFYSINLEKKSVVDIKKELSFYEKRISNTKRTGRALIEIEDQRLEIEALFLNEENIIDFIKELEYLAEEASVSLEMKNVSLPTDAESQPSFAFNVAGSFVSIYRYIAFLESNHYQLILDKIYIQKSFKDENWEANLELRFLNFEYNGT